MYVGWKYGTSGTLESNRTNENKSPIYTTVESWYNTNIVNKGYEEYISKTAIYCNDRNVGEGTYSPAGNAFYYVTYTRLVTNKIPTLKCETAEDRFTDGFGLMTADEVSFAGGLWGTNNANAYYYLNGNNGNPTGYNDWWTMSPSYWRGGVTQYAYMFLVRGTSGYPGQLSHSPNYNTVPVVRPVISLNSNAVLSGGTGTFTNPYKVGV